jgi:nucleolar protein 56
MTFLKVPSLRDGTHTEGILNEDLKTFLEANVPATKPGKKAKVQLGVSDAKLGSSIQDTLGIACVANDSVTELLRGIRQHFTKFVSELKDGELEKAQLGLAHSYSRSKVKFNVNRVDNMIIQSVSILDTLDKDINTFAMRVKYAPPPSRSHIAGSGTAGTSPSLSRS